jgi:hypothetical protein
MYAIKSIFSVITKVLFSILDKNSLIKTVKSITNILIVSIMYRVMLVWIYHNIFVH